MAFYKSSTMGFGVLVYVFHTYLDIRQLKALRIPHPPSSMAKYRSSNGDSAEFKKTQAYNVDKWWFNLVHGVWSIACDILLLASNVLPRLWATAAGIVARRGFRAATEIQTSVLFVIFFSAIPMVLETPWSFYSTFVVEQRHGFNKQTMRLFVTDLLKSAVLGLAIAPPLVAIFTYVLLNSGRLLVVYIWAFALAVQLTGLTIYPYIARLFNKFEPLPEGELREEIEALASSLKFPLKKLYVVDGSTRSAHSNAYMFGLGKNKRIVLFDTLVDQCSTEQHWKLGHILRNLVLANAVLLCQMALFTLVQHNERVLADFGFVKHRPALARFVLFTYLLAPLDEVLGFFSHVLSRRYEFQADEFAVGLGKGEALKGGLLSLEESNRSAANVDGWFSAFHYSHPPIPERMNAIDNLMKKDK